MEEIQDSKPFVEVKVLHRYYQHPVVMDYIGSTIYQIRINGQF
jgi:hypothetical protein